MSLINEFVEKLIDRLEEELKTAREMQTTQCIGHDGYGTLLQSKLGGEICALLKVQNIVNQLAKEYKDVPDTNVGKWIPVSERLPDENKYSDYYESVIVTLDNGRVVDGCYRNIDKEWWVDAVDGEHYSVNATGHVIAWQPLPEAYKD